MPVNLQERAQQAIEAARTAGASDAWATATRSRDVQFQYRDGQIEKVKDTTSRNLTVQVYAAGRYSSHATTDLAPERLRRFIAEAVAITRALEVDEFREITPEALFANRPTADLDLVDETVAGLSREQRLEWCQALDAAATSHDRVISATAGVYDGTLETAHASSNGFAGKHMETYCWYGSQITLRDVGEKRASDGYYVGGQHVGSLPPAGDVAETALQRALARLGAEKGPSAKTHLVVDRRAAASLIGRLMRPATARGIQQGRSFWADLIGEQAFSEALTIVDDPLIPRGFGSRLFDQEGISARSLPVVEKGVVRNVYVDTYHGRKAGMEPTTGSMSNVVIAPGENDLDGLLRAAGDGVYATAWLGGNADATTGDFSLGVSGHLIENGIIGRAVGEMNITGNLRDLFSHLEAVGNDVYPYSPTLSPSLLFSEVDFSGA
jgi:PmbA protein